MSNSELEPIQMSDIKYPLKEGDLVEEVMRSNRSTRSNRSRPRSNSKSSSKPNSKSSSKPNSKSSSKPNSKSSSKPNSKSSSKPNSKSSSKPNSKSRSRPNSKSRSNSNSNSKSSSKPNSKSRSNSSSSSGSSNDHIEECKAFIEVFTYVLEQPDNVDASIYYTNPEDIQEEYDDYVVFIRIWNKNTEKLCAYVQYNSSEKVIHIEEITRCSGEILPEQGSGTDIVKKIIEVGDEFRNYLDPGTNLSIMIGSDESKIKVKGVEFDLRWLYIFTTGESWYNSLGFEEEEYSHNKEFITEYIDQDYNGTTIRERFQKIKRDLRDPDISVKTLQKYNKELNKNIDKFYTFNSKEVKLGNIASGQFKTKFSNISYDYPAAGVGLGLKKKRRTRKRSIKKHK